MSAVDAAGAVPVEVRSQLGKHWGVTITGAQHLHGELDQTYRVSTEEGSVVVKVRDGVSNGVLDLELAVLQRLAGDGLPVPHIVPTVDGRDRHEFDGSTIWVLEWLDGALWADVPHRPPELQRELGRVAARTARSLAGLEHADGVRTHHWDLRVAHDSIERHLDRSDGLHREIADRVLDGFSTRVLPILDSLPTGLVHQDLNDHNLLVGGPPGRPCITGVLDPGDALHSVRVSELAVAVAYSMLRSERPLDTAAEVVAGWSEVSTLTADEADCIFPMAMARLCVNATTWAERRHQGQEHYADARSGHTWTALERLDQVHPDVARVTLRTVAGLEVPVGIAASSSAATEAHEPSRAVISLEAIGLDPHRDAFDEIDPLDRAGIEAVAASDAPCYRPHLGIRLDRGGPADGSGGPATVQLGVELCLGTDTELTSPRSGRVVPSGRDDVIAIEHGDGPERFWSLWHGLAATSLTAGETIEPGDLVGTGRRVTVQLSAIPHRARHAMPRFVRPAERAIWSTVSPDPAPFLGLSPSAATTWLDAGQVTALRDERLAASQRSYYRRPMNLVRARGTWFVDDDGHRYLDAINNVTHVGHGHPRVVDAATRQMRRLNTNSRFVYEQMATYADRLAGLLPDPLEVVFLVCTGSEANDLALRIARQVTGHDDIMVIDGAYHGNTTAVTGISPNRYKGSGGTGPPPTTHEVQQPNRYRGPHTGDDAGPRYAADVDAVASRLVAEGRPPAAFIAESLMGTAGQLIHPDGYLAESFAHARAAGGLCISDEVQVGFGRLGARFWGFELGGVVPDIVTMGKPMGNGHPIAAVVTTREIADAFDTGMKYFNTFGGNPVSCAVAGAVLDVIDDEGLQQRALDVGGRFLGRLAELAARHTCIGDVRGEGLYLGVELVRDRDSKEPAAALTTEVCERMRELGVVVYPNGDLGNVLKIKPPMVFSLDDVDVFVERLDRVLRELTWSV